MDTGRTVTPKLQLSKRKTLPVLAVFFVVCHPRILGSETLTLTTYYPAPYGAYVAMLTTRQTLLARDGGNVGIGVKIPQAKLDVVSTTSGFLPPRMTTVQRDVIPGTPAGSIIFNTTSGKFQGYDGTGWVDFSGTSASLPSIQYQCPIIDEDHCPACNTCKGQLGGAPTCEGYVVGGVGTASCPWTCTYIGTQTCYAVLR